MVTRLLTLVLSVSGILFSCSLSKQTTRSSSDCLYRHVLPTEISDSVRVRLHGEFVTFPKEGSAYRIDTNTVLVDVWEGIYDFFPIPGEQMVFTFLSPKDFVFFVGIGALPETKDQTLGMTADPLPQTTLTIENGLVSLVTDDLWVNIYDPEGLLDSLPKEGCWHLIFQSWSTDGKKMTFYHSEGQVYKFLFWDNTIINLEKEK